MFKFMIKFLKILAIACLIGVSLRVIEVLFLKQQAKDLAVSNITNEVQNEEVLQVADKEEKIVNEIIEDKNSEEKAIIETEKEVDIVQDKQQENVKTAKQETVKTQTNNVNKKEEKQKTTTKQTITETSKQEEKETKQETSTQTPTKTETKTEEKYTEVVVNMAEKKECTGNNHGMGVGNSGKWFNTKDEAIATYKAEIKIWGDKWTDKDNPISDEEYYKNCPYGYEVWTCMYCGKWTLNYYYDN